MAVDDQECGWLLVGAAKTEITPPLEVGLLMSSVDARWAEFQDVRKPLLARSIVLEGPGDSSGMHHCVAIVALDLLTLSGKALGGFQEFKTRISDAAAGVVAPEDIVLACTHTHTAPESGAITDLYLTSEFQSWIELLISQIGKAVAAATADRGPCTADWGTTTAPGLGIHRRFKTTGGVLMSHPEPPAEVVLSRDGAVDDSVNVLRFRDESGKTIAVAVNATCHPVYEMCIPEVSPDYPGELCTLLEEKYPGALVMFLNGAAGNVNPRGVSAGADAARAHARQLAASVAKALELPVPVAAPRASMRRRTFTLPSRLPQGTNVGRKVTTEVVGLSLGDVALAFLTGEPFAETALAIRRQSPFRSTFIVGFSEETIGYIPTDEAFREGGYEVGFGTWSVLAPGSEEIVRLETKHLLHELHSPKLSRAGAPAPHAFGAEVSGTQPVSGRGSKIKASSPERR